MASLQFDLVKSSKREKKLKKINSSNNKYSFWDKREYTDENGVVFKNSIRRKGITFHAKTIKNITIDDE